MARVAVGLDNSIFANRLRIVPGSNYLSKPPVVAQPRGISDIYAAQPAKPLEPSQHVSPIASQPRQLPSTAPALPRQEPSQVLRRQFASNPTATPTKKSFRLTANRVITGMSILVFTAGLSVAALGFRTNHHVEAQVQAIAQKAATTGGDPSDAPPTETKPSSHAISSYTVPPDQPKTITIPKIKVNARVRAVGQTRTGALGVPSNIYDTAWYTDSLKPGQTGGATIIDGHVSGPTHAGVFKNLSKLTAGDMIQVTRGDGQVFNYKVVKSQAFNATQTDMQSAMSSADPTKPGLNLISCTGKVTGHEYDQRLIVYAVQV